MVTLCAQRVSAKEEMESLPEGYDIVEVIELHVLGWGSGTVVIKPKSS